MGAIEDQRDLVTQTEDRVYRLGLELARRVSGDLMADLANPILRVVARELLEASIRLGRQREWLTKLEASVAGGRDDG
jgi:hypothetical protein